MERVQPSGTVTFLFTDVEDHTRLWEEFPEEMPTCLERHDDIVRGAIEGYGGYVFSTAGDAFSAAFPSVELASTAAVEAQQRLRATAWPEGCELRVRMGLHTGEAQERDDDYFGPSVIRAARLMSLGHGGQVLVSALTADVLAERTEFAPMVKPLGDVELRGLARVERVSELRYPGLDVQFPPLVASVRELGYLPRISDELIGRQGDVADCADLLRTSSLVTLVGPGGVGKTRLSIEAASYLADGFVDGVWFVGLAAVTDESAVPNAVAEVLGVQETAGRTLTESIVGAIAGRDLLLILDNCEHVVEAARSLAKAVVEHCATVTALATSREPLTIAGERVLPVQPLPVGTSSEVATAPAVALFVARAHAADPDFAINDENLETVSAICQQLDGMPLAIELAAARVRGLGLDGIADHLGDRFRLLRSRGGVSPRHQTLRATVGWSYDLLDVWLRELFCRAGVFAGGFTREAGEHVLSYGELDALDAADGLAELVDKSMLQTVGGGTGRYRMLETMRQFGEGEIPADSRTESQRRFVDYYVAHAQGRAAEVAGPAPSQAVLDMRREYDNYREAFRLAMRHRAHDEAAGLVLALHEFGLRTVVGESFRWAQELFEQMTPADERFGDVAASAMWGAQARGDRVIARQLADRVEGSERAGELTPSAFTNHQLAVLYWFRSETQRSVYLHELALAQARAVADAALESYVLGTLSMAQDSFDRVKAYASAERALEIGRALDRPLSICGGLLAFTGVVVHDDQARACGLAEELVELAHDNDLLWFEATGTRLLAHALSRLGDLGRASGLYVRALDLNGVGDAGELLWYTIINATEHLWRVGDTAAAAVALGALTAAPAAPTDDLISRASRRLRARLDDESGLALGELEDRGRSMRLADLLRFLHDRLSEHADSASVSRDE